VTESISSSQSNGIVIGYGLPIFPGIVAAPPFQMDLDQIEATFEGFRTPESTGGMYYEVAIGSQLRQSTFNTEDAFSVMDYTCVCIGEFRCPGFDTCIEGTFSGTGQRLISTINDVQYVASDGAISVELVGLELGTGGRYFVSVRATNEAGISNTAQSNPIVIDLTPPVEGTIAIVGSETKDVAYVPDATTFGVSWDGWFDPESGIETFGLAVVAGKPDECAPTPDPDVLELVEHNATSHTFAELNLNASESYFVVFVAINRVGLTTRIISAPVYLDVDEPESGMVRTGVDLYKETPYATSRTALQGTLLQVLNPKRLVCPLNRSEFVVDRGYGRDIVLPTGWEVLGDFETRGIVHFNQDNLDSSRDGLGMTLKRDIMADQMTSAAVIAEAGLYPGAVHDFKIKLGGRKGAATSILFVKDTMKSATVKKSLDDLRLIGMEQNFYRTFTDTLNNQDWGVNLESQASKDADMYTHQVGDHSTTFGEDGAAFIPSVSYIDQNRTADGGNASFGIRAGIEDSFGLQFHIRSTFAECTVLNATQCTNFCGVTEEGFCRPVTTVLLWARFDLDEKEPEYLWIDLDFDASKDTHIYGLVYEEARGAGLPVWSLTLKVDGKSVGELIDVPQLPLGGGSSKVIHRWFAGTELPVVDVDSPLDAWADVTYIETISVSKEDSPLPCQHDVAWHQFSSPVRYEVAVGRVMYGVDVQDYVEVDVDAGSKYLAWDEELTTDAVVELTRPCINQCDGGEQPRDCEADEAKAAELRQVVFEVGGLDLSLGDWIDPDPSLLRVSDTAASLGISKEQFDVLLSGSIHDAQGNPIEGMPDKMFQPAIYYLTVRAVTGSGKTIASTSEGIMMDTTPPEFAPSGDTVCEKVEDTPVGAAAGSNKVEVYHAAATECGKEPEMFDPDQMIFIDGYPIGFPSLWQASTTSLAAQWLAIDDESGVVEYRWTLGDRGSRSSVLPWTSVGVETVSTATGLTLQHLGSYCATVRAFNGAGLYRESKSPATCIRVDATPPIVGFVEPILPDSRFAGGALSYRDDVPIGVAFGGASDPDSGMQSYKVGLGISPYAADGDGSFAGQELFPLTTLSGNEGANITFNAKDVHSVHSKELLLPGEEKDLQQSVGYTNLIAEVLPSDFGLKLQRGARHFFTVEAKNGAGATAISTSVPYTFLGPASGVEVLQSDSAVPVTVQTSTQNPKLLSTVISRSEAQCKGVVATGLLTNEEVAATYTSANVPGSFTPYIQDPRKITMETSSRYLRGRANKDTYMDTSMFVTALEQGGTGCPVFIDVKHQPIPPNAEDEFEAYSLAYFNTVNNMWTEVYGSCADRSGGGASVGEASADLGTNTSSTTSTTTTTLADNKYKLCDHTNGGRNQVDSALHLAFFHLIGDIPNTAPVVVDVSLSTDENTISEPVQLESTDAELDDVLFALDEATLAGGTANMTSDGLFTFAPAFSYHGTLRIKYTVTETLEPHLGLTPLTSSAFIIITVAPVPSNPTLSPINVKTGELMPRGTQFFAGYLNTPVTFKLLMVDFDGEDISLVERGVPADAVVTSAQADLDQARVFAAQEWSLRCESEECEYPWSSFSPTLLKPSAFEITINVTLDTTGLQEIQMLAKDSSGAFSTMLRADLVACEIGHWFNPLADAENLCSLLTVCEKGYFEVASESILEDTVCFAPNTDSGSGDVEQSAEKSNGAGLAVGLTFLFIILLVGVALLYRHELEKKNRSSIGATLSAQRAANAHNFENPMYGAVAPDRGGINNVKYAVPMEDEDGMEVYDDADKIYAADDVTYSIPMEEPASVGVSNPLYSVPFDNGTGDIYAPESQGTNYSIPFDDASAEAVYSLEAVSQPEGIYGAPGSVGVESGIYADADVYGWIRGTDTNSEVQLPYLFTAALNRAGAESIITSHGGGPGTFLLRVKGSTGFAITMQGQEGFEHHLLKPSATGSFTLNSNPLVGEPTTLDAAVAVLSDASTLVDLSVPLSAAVCIPQTATSNGSVPAWIHGSMTQEKAEKILTANGGSSSGLFMVYQRTDGVQVLAVLESASMVRHMIVTNSDTNIDVAFHLDGTPVPDALDWFELRRLLAIEGGFMSSMYSVPLVKGVRREQTPPELISLDSKRPTWMYAAISRDAANNRLAGCEEGSFLVRESTDSPFEFKVSAVAGTKIKHHKLVVDPATNGWTVNKKCVPGVTLNDVIVSMQDKSISKLKFELTIGIQNEPDYIVSVAREVEGAGVIYAPATDGDQDVQLTSTKDQGVYAAVSDGVFIARQTKRRPDTVFVQGGNDVYMSADALNRPQSVVVSNSGVKAKVRPKTVFVDTSGNPYIKNDEYLDGEALVSKSSVHMAAQSGVTYAIPTSEDATYASPSDDAIVAGSNGQLYAIPSELYAAGADVAHYDTPNGEGVELVASGNAIYAIPTEQTLGAYATGADVAHYGDAVNDDASGVTYAVPSEEMRQSTHVASEAGKIYNIPMDMGESTEEGAGSSALYAVPAEEPTTHVASQGGAIYTIPMDTDPTYAAGGGESTSDPVQQLGSYAEEDA
jgi:hypothetical protein